MWTLCGHGKGVVLQARHICGHAHVAHRTPARPHACSTPAARGQQVHPQRALCRHGVCMHTKYYLHCMSMRMRMRVCLCVCLCMCVCVCMRLHVQCPLHVHCMCVQPWWSSKYFDESAVGRAASRCLVGRGDGGEAQARVRSV